MRSNQMAEMHLLALIRPRALVAYWDKLVAVLGKWCNSKRSSKRDGKKLLVPEELQDIENGFGPRRICHIP